MSVVQPDHILFRGEILFSSQNAHTNVCHYLHGVDGDGEGRVVPVHLVLLAALLVGHCTLVCGSDAEHAQDDHKHQEADAHHDDDGGGAGYHCDEANTKW